MVHVLIYCVGLCVYTYTYEYVQIPNNPLQSFTDGNLASPVPMMIVSEGVHTVFHWLLL